MKNLTISEVKTLIENAEEAFPHNECYTCECFLGYVTHLSAKSDEGGKQILKDYRPHRENIHSCMGCDPCPPGDLYAEYLRANKKK